MRALFTHLATHREEVATAHERVLASREEHTWEARARQVIRDLAGQRHRS